MNALLVLDVGSVRRTQICDEYPIRSGYEQGVRLGHGVLRTEHRDELRARIDELRLALAATDYKIAAYTRELEEQATPDNINTSDTDKENPS